MSNRNARRHRHTKGVVLFTVVAIMLFLLIMVMSTLAVVSSAQKRTYTKFKENQAYFTARSGIASFLRGASETDDTSPLIALHDEFLDLCKTGNEYDDSGKSFADLESSSDVMTMTVSFPQPPQSGGDLKYLYGECKVYAYKTGSDKAKIVSRATLGGSESVVTLYITVPPQKPELFKNAMTSFANVSNSTMGVLGGVTAFVDPANSSKTDPSKAAAGSAQFVNNGYVSRNTVFGSGATISTQTEFIFSDVVGKQQSDGTYIDSSAEYMGLTVMGDLSLTNTANFYGDIKGGKTPYIYTDGRLSISTGPMIGADFDTKNISDSSDNKVDIYCNTFTTTNTPKINGNLYIFGESEDTDFAYMTDDGKDTANNKFNGEIWGDIYCNGDLYIENSAKIHGDVYCTGTVKYQNFGSAGIDGNIYATTFLPDGSNSDLKPDSGNAKMQAYSEPDDFKDKDWVKENVIANVEDQYNDFGGVDKENKPLNDGSIYPAFGYYTDDDGNWKPRTEVDSSWSIWNPNDYFQMNDQNETAYIDATENNLSIVVPSGFFPSNTKNNRIVIKGDKRVDFYITEKPANPWWPGDITTNVSSSNQNSANGNMVITEDFNNRMNAGQDIYLSCPGEDNVQLNVYYYVQDGLTYNIEGDLLMGYIYGPNAKINMNNGVAVSNVHYDGVSYGNVANLQFIGSCVTSDITTGNNVNGIFLPPANDNNGGKGKFWTDLYYLNY